MNEKPFHNEPGFVKQIGGWEVESYNDVVRHETLRVAVCDALERENYPKEHMYVLISVVPILGFAYNSILYN